MLSSTHIFGTLLILPFYLVQAQSATFICATQNTGTDFNTVFAQFQSRGACSITCSGYAFAILQGSNCWCSNFFPATEVATSECDTGCPGFGTDICGGTLNGAFAYYQLAQASGTRQASSAAAAATSTAQAATSSTAANAANPTTRTTSAAAGPVTVVVTRTATPSPGTTASSTTSTSSSSTSPQSSSTVQQAVNPNSSTATRTSFVTSPTSANTSTRSPSATALQIGASESLKSSNGFFDSPGKVAGTFVAVGLVVLALLLALLWFCCRRRRQRRSDSANRAAAAAGLNRKTSSTSTVENQSAFSDARSRTESASGLLGARGEKPVGRVSPNALNWPIETGEIVPIDQRMNPKPMLMRFDSNYSRHSLRDDEDYSRRVLTVANPES